MPLLAFNLTGADVTLDAGNPAPTLPASLSPPNRSEAYNVTAELRPNLTVDPAAGVVGGLSAANFALIQLQVDAGDIEFEWTDVNPEYLTTGLTIGGSSPGAHAATHLTGGADELDGDQLDIDFTPTNYTPTTAPAEATSLDHLTAHLAGIDGALKTGKGALIVMEKENIYPLIDGGFKVNCRFTPQRLIELTKMDGAIVLSKDGKKILWANVLLTPESKINTSETGTRHKAAERTARQIGTLTIAISERRSEITLFYKTIRYPLKSTSEVLRKANDTLQVLEKQRELFDKNVDKLTKAELRNHNSLSNAIQVIQKGQMIQKISEDMKRYLIEAGKEGALIRTRLKELTSDVEKETNLVVKDYTKLDLRKSKNIINSLIYDEIIDSSNILGAMAYEKSSSQSVILKGWRILSKTSLQEQDIAKIIQVSGSLGKALYSNFALFIPEIGEEKAKQFKDELERIKLN